ncbi:MAG: cytochrome P450, partial [Deltaproteobacteria bacterium]
RDPLPFLLAAHREYGPVFRVRAMNQEIVVLAGVEANQFVAQHGAKHLENREFWKDFGKEVEASNLLHIVDGRLHARLRKVMKPGFSAATLARQIPLIVGTTERIVATWQPGERIEVVPFLRRLVTEQLGLLLANRAPGPYFEDLWCFMTTLLNVTVLKKWPRWMLYRPAYRRAKRRMWELAQLVIDEHREGPREREPDLIDDILSAAAREPDLFPPSELRMVVLAPFIAGLDTVVGTISFLLHALLTHPDILARVRAEAEAVFADGPPPVDRLRRMTDLHGAVMETLRRYPVTPAIQRGVCESFEFAGYRVEAGSLLLILTAAPHFLAEYYPNPERFDIERYREPRKEHRSKPGVFAPFGLGSHTCLGAGLAELQIMLTTATLLARARIELDPPGAPLRKKINPLPYADRLFVRVDPLPSKGGPH